MGFKLKSGNKPQFKQVGSSPARHAAYGQPHPINPQGKEQPVGAGHPATPEAHNVKPEKKESPAKEGFVKEKLNRKIRRKERKADKARAQSKEAIAKSNLELTKGEDMSPGYANRMYKKAVRKTEKAKKKERKADKAYTKGVKTNKRIKENNPKRYEKSYERKIKKIIKKGPSYIDQKPLKKEPNKGRPNKIKIGRTGMEKNPNQVLEKSPAKQGVIFADEKKHGTIKEQQARNKAFVEQRARMEARRRKSLTPEQRAKEDSTSNAQMQRLRDAMKPKTKKSPAKTHDGTKSSTTHYKDGSAKSQREVAFSKRHEAEVKKGDANRGDGDYQKRKEQLLNQGFTQKDADHMIKNKAVTGRVNEKAKAEHPKYEKRKKWKPAYEGGDYSKKDLRKMSRKERKKIEKGQE